MLSVAEHVGIACKAVALWCGMCCVQHQHWKSVTRLLPCGVACSPHCVNTGSLWQGCCIVVWDMLRAALIESTLEVCGTAVVGCVACSPHCVNNGSLWQGCCPVVWDVLRAALIVSTMEVCGKVVALWCGIFCVQPSLSQHWTGGVGCVACSPH